MVGFVVYRLSGLWIKLNIDESHEKKSNEGGSINVMDVDAQLAIKILNK